MPETDERAFIVREVFDATWSSGWLGQQLKTRFASEGSHVA
jgi:hypothetical protein